MSTDSTGGSMELTISPTAVHEAWDRTVVSARRVLAGADVSGTRARGDELGDLAPATARAWARATGAAGTAIAVCDEHTTNVDACLLAYAASDRTSAGVFNGLAR